MGRRGFWHWLASWLAWLRPRTPAGTLDGLPSWAVVGRRRRRHIKRVAALLEQWADQLGVRRRERERWLKAAWLHDALRDARLPNGTTHGAAAADRAECEGETDRGVLDAVRYHSVGFARWEQVGRMLYLADFLEPGRKGRHKERARLAKRAPRDPGDVLREVVALQMREQLRSGRPIHPLTTEFWNAIAGAER